MVSITDYLNRDKPKPQADQSIGIGGFTAFVRVRDSYRRAADVPTVPVEDGSFLNDHIILKPLAITIEGDVSDIHLRAQPRVERPLRLPPELADIIGEYEFERTQSQIDRALDIVDDAVDQVRSLEDQIERGRQILDIFGNQTLKNTGGGAKSLQEQFLDAMEALHLGKQLITIDMPFRRLDNMVITSFVSQTDNQTDNTVFTIEAQQVRLATLEFAQIRKPSPGLGGQTAPEQDQGTQEGEPVEESLAFQIKTSLTGG